MKRILAACIVLPTAALMGCSPARIKNAYEGPDRPASEVAILFSPKQDAYADKRPQALFSAVDGKHYGTFIDGYPAVTSVLPGTVMVKVNCVNPGPLTTESFLLFEATLKAGHYYELACDRFSASAIDRGMNYESVRDLLPAAVEQKLKR